MSVTQQRVSRRQVAALKHLAITCETGGLTTLTRDEREAMQPLWRRGLIELWFRCVPDEGTQRTAFFRPSAHGWLLIRALFGASTAERAA